MDELRVWRTVRTQSEIQQNYRRQFTAADIAANSANLALLSNFDDDSDPLTILDDSGKTSDGIVGEWDARGVATTTTGCQATAAYRYGADAVDPPTFAFSTAPINGGSSIPIVAAIEPGVPHHFSLYSFDPLNQTITTRVTSLPAFGSLFLTNGTDPVGSALTLNAIVPSGVVWYVPGGSFGVAGDSFQYSATNADGTSVATVNLRCTYPFPGLLLLQVLTLLSFQ